MTEPAGAHGAATACINLTIDRLWNGITAKFHTHSYAFTFPFTFAFAFTFAVDIRHSQFRFTLCHRSPICIHIQHSGLAFVILPAMSLSNVRVTVTANGHPTPPPGARPAPAPAPVLLLRSPCLAALPFSALPFQSPTQFARLSCE